MTENEISRVVVDAAFKLHSDLGPGLLESVYETLLARELEVRGLKVTRQQPIAFEYRGFKFD
jgi:GxxExxY protein